MLTPLKIQGATFHMSEYTSPEATLKELEEFMKDGVEANRLEFKDPNDDWMPIYVVVMPDGRAMLFTGQEDKHVFVNIVAHFAREFGAVGIAQLNSSWLQKRDTPPVPGESIAGKPGSEEGLMLVLYTRTDWRVEWAAIKRDGKNPPALAPWEVTLRRNEAEVRGDMFDPLFQALRKN